MTYTIDGKQYEFESLSDAAKACKKIRQLSVAFLFAETIRRISDGESVTSLFAEQNNNF